MNTAKAITVVLLGAGSSMAQAALSPSSLNQRDLDTMTRFIAQHSLVAQQLKTIDMQALTITYGDDCVAIFERAKPGVFASKRPGPQPDIEFVRSNCPLDEQ